MYCDTNSKELKRERRIKSNKFETRTFLGIVTMEVGNKIAAIKYWGLEQFWYVRKGLREINQADPEQLPTILLPTRSKCNFTMESILATYCVFFLNNPGFNSYILLNESSVSRSFRKFKVCKYI